MLGSRFFADQIAISSNRQVADRQSGDRQSPVQGGGGQASPVDLRTRLKGDKKTLAAKTFFPTREQSTEVDAALLRAGARIKHGRFEHSTEPFMAIA
nr:hypothetical protein [uncultured Rhodopila sp.]